MDYNDTGFIRNKLKLNDSRAKSKDLKPMPELAIRCGKGGGLPFEHLMTDCYSGCLCYDNICYGNCTAALFWLDQGYDFGKRVINKWDEELFEKDLKSVASEQKWFRQGWVSDCSFSQDGWVLVSKISDVLARYNRHLLIITKGHSLPTDEILRNLAKNKVEIRVSLSALDSIDEISRRFKLLELYRQAGGISIPYVMSCRYRNQELRDNQDYIVKYIIDNDYIAGEHPLRVSRNNILISELEDNGFYHPKYTDQYWFGRILDVYPNFVLPAPTHLASCYKMEYRTFSQIKNKKYIKGATKNLPTYEDLLHNRIKNRKELERHAAYSDQR